MKQNGFLYMVCICLIFSLKSNGQKFDSARINNNINQIAFKLLPLIEDQCKGNGFIFSPYSLISAISMVYEGSSGLTKTEIQKLINPSLQRENYLEAFKSFEDDLLDTTHGMSLNVSNSLWVQEKYKILPAFSENIQKHFDGLVRQFEANTASQAANSTREINLFIEKKSHGQLKDVIPGNLIDPFTKLILINTIAFETQWKFKFDVGNTKEDTFFIYNGSQEKTLFMNQTCRIGYYEDPITQAVSIPYEGNRFSMLILLPCNENVMRKFINSLTIENFSVLTDKMYQREVELIIPKFKAESGLELKAILQSLGIRQAFNDNADFSMVTGNKELLISDVFQKSVIDVNERETKAASATVVPMQLKSAASIAEPVIFKADRAFLYFIIDNRLHTILFVGKYNRP